MTVKRRPLNDSVLDVVHPEWRLRYVREATGPGFNDINTMLEHLGTFKNAAFDWILLFITYSYETDLKPSFGRVNKTYKDQSVSICVKKELLFWCDQNNLVLASEIGMIAVLEAIIALCKKYKLNSAPFEAERLKYGHIPDTVEECATYVIQNPDPRVVQMEKDRAFQKAERIRKAKEEREALEAAKDPV